MQRLWNVVALATLSVPSCTTAAEVPPDATRSDVASAVTADVTTDVTSSAVSWAGDTMSSSTTVDQRAPDFTAVEGSGGVTTLTYDDVAGHPRTVLAELRLPDQAAGPSPVVVWSHGGSSGKRSTARVGVEWGRAFTGRGMAFVAIAHAGRSVEAREQLCGALGVDDCSRFMYLDWDRPADVAVVMAWLEQRDDPRLDLDRLAYGGHSAGARSVLRVAGADMPIAGNHQPRSDVRFGAFVVASPPGRSVLDLDESSFVDLDRPVFVVSGAGDTTEGNAAPDRRATIELMPTGVTTAVWVDDDVTRHTTFDLSTTSCERAGGTTERCREIVRWIGTTGARFVQAMLSGEASDAFERDAVSRMPDGFSIVR